MHQERSSAESTATCSYHASKAHIILSLCSVSIQCYYYRLSRCVVLPIYSHPNPRPFQIPLPFCDLCTRDCNPSGSPRLRLLSVIDEKALLSHTSSSCCWGTFDLMHERRRGGIAGDSAGSQFLKLVRERRCVAQFVATEAPGRSLR
jgi:hypothetical protein